jgi:hypothetical protein
MSTYRVVCSSCGYEGTVVGDGTTIGFTRRPMKREGYFWGRRLIGLDRYKSYLFKIRRVYDYDSRKEAWFATAPGHSRYSLDVMEWDGWEWWPAEVVLPVECVVKEHKQ